MILPFQIRRRSYPSNPHKFARKIGASPYAAISTDELSEAITIYGVPKGLTIGRRAQKYAFKSKVRRIWLHHEDGTVTYYGQGKRFSWNEGMVIGSSGHGA